MICVLMFGMALLHRSEVEDAQPVRRSCETKRHSSSGARAIVEYSARTKSEAPRSTSKHI